jgi:hypothetical protein
MLPHCREVMGEEDRSENQDKEGYHSLWEMLQGPFRDTVWARSLSDLETSDGFLNLKFLGMKLGD